MDIPRAPKTSNPAVSATRVIKLSLPGHNSHRLQTLDVPLFRPLSSCQCRAICHSDKSSNARWLRIWLSRYCG